MAEQAASLNELDRQLVLATQGGLPIVPAPYAKVAAELGVSEALVMERLRAMLASGRIRRIALVPNHYRLGYVANGMSVWDIPDAYIREVGQAMGRMPAVSHCYHRPRHGEAWPYNLFAMVHGHSREEVEQRVAEMARQLGERQRGHDILFSTRILKKTGMRFGAA